MLFLYLTLHSRKFTFPSVWHISPVIPRYSIYVCILTLEYILTIDKSPQVGCALLMAGENLDNHIDVKNILVEMGTYFQVQVILYLFRQDGFQNAICILCVNSRLSCVKNQNVYTIFFFSSCLSIVGWLFGLLWWSWNNWEGEHHYLKEMINFFKLMSSFKSSS